MSADIWRRPAASTRPSTIVDGWLCRRCGRNYRLTHPYKWIGVGKARRRVCVECLAAKAQA
jgi:hypothetical protein